MSHNASSAGFGTRAIHVGAEANAETGAVIAPISLSTTYKQDGVGKHKVSSQHPRTKTSTHNFIRRDTSTLALATPIVTSSKSSWPPSRPVEATLLPLLQDQLPLRPFSKLWAPMRML